MITVFFTTTRLLILDTLPRERKFNYRWEKTCRRVKDLSTLPSPTNRDPCVLSSANSVTFLGGARLSHLLCGSVACSGHKGPRRRSSEKLHQLWRWACPSSFSNLVKTTANTVYMPLIASGRVFNDRRMQRHGCFWSGNKRRQVFHVSTGFLRNWRNIVWHKL
jgi:hypothetical protein